MKIGDLFVALGFQTTGAKDLIDAQKATQQVAVQAGKAALGIDALSASFGLMIALALEGATALSNFARSTGLSTDELQQWQFTAEKGNVSGKEIADTIKSIQKAGADIRLGRGNIAPWQLLGVDPTQDPFVVLKNLRDSLNRFPADIARTVAADAGISDNVFQLLRMSSLEFDKMGKQFVIQQQQAQRLAEIRGQWAGIGMEIRSLGIQLTDVFRPAIQWTVDVLQKAVEIVGTFVHWLNSGSTAANIIRDILIVVAAAVAGLAIAITTLTAAATALTVVLAAASVLPAVWAMGLLAVAVLAVSAAIVGLIALYQDLWVKSQGGKSLFDWDLAIRGGSAMAAVIQTLIGLVDLLRGRWRAAGDDFMAGWHDLKDSGILGDFKPATTPPAGASGSKSAVTQQNTLHVTVDGSKDPHHTALTITDHFKRMVADAAYQAALTAIGY